MKRLKKLKVYAVFYLNQMFSAISYSDRSIMIKKCFWPLLELIEAGFPAGIAISGVSLEITNQLDPEWVARLKKNLKEKKCELIGSGYAQIIAPLVPAGVNEHNIMLGVESYEQLLSIKPSIATINEMAYSSGIIEHYIKAGYEAILMEWNNPRRYHPEWEDAWRYHRQKALNQQGQNIRTLWVDTIAFQKFQRYIHGELEQDQYWSYLESQQQKANGGYVCIYASDSEIFDFRPGRYGTEAMIKDGNEWKKIRELFEHLRQSKSYELLLPSEILKQEGKEKMMLQDNNLVLESEQQPIPVKKQEKYNIYRWALTGRNDLFINTTCYQRYHALKARGGSKDDWKKLCYFWSSDFRTHITEERWNDYLKELTSFARKNEKN